MRKKLAALLFLAVPAIAAPQRLNFHFQDASLLDFQSQSWGEEIQKHFGVMPSCLVLILTPSSKDPSYSKQNPVLSKLDAEELKFILVIANLEDEFKGGYHTSTSTAASLGANVFGVFILDIHGRVLHHSATPLSVSKLKGLLKANAGT
jgi:hypothetical protein